MKPLLIIETGHAPAPIRGRHGDFSHWFRLALQVPPAHVHRIDVQSGEALPPPRMCAGAVITGSTAMVTDGDAWSESVADWIRKAMGVELPLFGVCYGHQLMAHALGGRVGALPDGREIGTQYIELLPDAADDPLLRGLPARFRAHTTHQQSVLAPPPGARVLARSAQDPHQILRYGKHAISTQFHPEFSATVMRAYLRLRAPQLHAESRDMRALLSAVGAAPHARRLLRGFALHRTTS
jgi:GMP synthase (glutamine-hydrolysing)